MAGTDVVVALTTCAGRAEAEALANALVEEQLCACVNIVGPITSVYRWQGKVERGEEFLCIAKTLASMVAPLQARLPQLHGYDVPELVVLPVTAGLPSYLAWVGSSVGAPRAS